jgi:hypothetical protein
MNEALDPETAAIAAKFLENLMSGKCPVCNTEPDFYKQVGPCVYCEPCGHRIGRGSAKEWNKRKEQKQDGEIR